VRGIATNRSGWPALSFVVSKPAISLFTVFLLAILAALARGASGDAPEITYHTATAEVRLTFFATDERGHAIRNLGRQDFAVVDRDDVVRNFQSFARTEWAKLDITMLVDTSESVAPHYKQEIAHAAGFASGANSGRPIFGDHIPPPAAGDDLPGKLPRIVGREPVP
jgi:hypothetical protein